MLQLGGKQLHKSYIDTTWNDRCAVQESPGERLNTSTRTHRWCYSMYASQLHSYTAHSQLSVPYILNSPSHSSCIVDDTRNDQRICCVLVLEWQQPWKSLIEDVPAVAETVLPRSNRTLLQAVTFFSNQIQLVVLATAMLTPSTYAKLMSAKRWQAVNMVHTGAAQPHPPRPHARTPNQQFQLGPLAVILYFLEYRKRALQYKCQ